MSYLIHNARVLTMNASLDRFEDGAVAIEGDSIVAVGDSSLLARYPSFERIDARRGILLPGFVNAHTHSGMVPFRSLGDDCPDRLRRFLFPLEASMTAELAAASARYACAEMLLSGVTTFVDMYYFEDAIAEAVKASGMRALLGETVVGFPSCDAGEPNGGLDRAERFMSDWSGDGLITPTVAPHATNTVEPDVILRARGLADRYSAPLTMHVSELDYEVALFREKYGKSPIAFLDSIGALDGPFIAAHCILADEGDLDRMARRGVSIAHCPGANAKAAKGVAPLKGMIERGLAVGLGTDGPASGNTLDLFEQMDLAAKLHKNANHDRGAFPTPQLVGLATTGGAAALGLSDSIGSIEAGKKADLVVVETDSVAMFPAFDPYAALVYSAKATNVDSVFVNGRPLVRGKRLVSLDLVAARAELEGLMGEFSRRAAELLATL